MIQFRDRSPLPVAYISPCGLPGHRIQDIGPVRNPTSLPALLPYHREVIEVMAYHQSQGLLQGVVRVGDKRRRHHGFVNGRTLPTRQAGEAYVAVGNNPDKPALFIPGNRWPVLCHEIDDLSRLVQRGEHDHRVAGVMESRT